MSKRPTITTHTKYTIIDGEAVLLNVRTGNYLALNETATYIFQQLEKGTDLAVIRSSLQKEYNVTETQLQEDLEIFLGEARQRGIIEYSS